METIAAPEHTALQPTDHDAFFAVLDTPPPLPKKFRAGFVRHRETIVSCLTLTRGAKNAADIRIVIDALHLLDHRSWFEEFVFVSGDSDVSPLLHQLPAEDCRTTIVSPG